MTPENTPSEFGALSPALEQAIVEIRDEALDPAVVEAAATRVWTRLAEAAAATNGSASAIRDCSDFQALIPEFRAGRLSDARAMLLQDHLHQCVSCRHVFEGRVVAMPAAPAAKRANYTARWALAATVLLAAGVTIWYGVNQYGERTGHAIVQSLDGTLYAVSADGIHQLVKGQDLPSDVELRTAKDSDAVLELADGSQVEVRERSSLFTTRSGSDITVRLGRGSVLVTAKHRRTGHLYVDTADCRVAVTGTVFGVTAGMKGSRVSVLQGEVHVTQDNQEKILHAGDQTATSLSVEPEPVSAEISWSHDRDKFAKQAANPPQQAPILSVRYDSKVLAHLPASTTLFISIPNLGQYMGNAESVLEKKMSANPQLHDLWNSRLSAVVDLIRTGSEYLGDEIDIVAAGGKGPVLLSEQRRDGFEEFLHKKAGQLTVTRHGDLMVFGPERSAVEDVAGKLDSGFQSTQLYGRIAQSYREGAGLLIWAQLSPQQSPFPGATFFVAEQKQVGKQIVASASLGFDGPRTGMAAQLAAPSAMGSLDYVSPDALAVLGFVVKDAGAIVDSALSVFQGSTAAAQRVLDDERQEKGFNVRDDLAASLGSEFAVAMDGPLMPVPSWKLVSEIYDPARFQATLQRFVDVHNKEIPQTHKKPLVMSQESVDGRTFYTFAQADSGPLMEAHYTFDRGYLVAGPTRALVTQALRLETAGTSIKHSSKFLELTPRDHHLNFSAVVYQNLGNSLAPLAAFAGAFAPQGAGRGANLLQNLTDIKPSLYAVYGEPDRITMRANGDVVGSMLSNLLNGNLVGMAGIPLPMHQMQGTHAVR